MKRRRRVRPATWILLATLWTLGGCRPKAVEIHSASSLEQYLQDARKPGSAAATSEGSLWVDRGRRSEMFRDLKAHDVNDIVTIRVVESTQAVATAEAKNSKETAVNTGFDGLFGMEGKVKELSKLASGSGSSSFEGKGSTTRETTLRTFITARVVDVLPNGYLVVEGVRDVRLNHENQSLFLSGVVRPDDVSPDNVVVSSAVGQMTIRLQGKGSVSRPINPGWLYKILSGIMPF